MDKPTVLGYMHDQPRALKYAFENREEFLKPFVEIFKEHNIKKVLFFGSGTSYNASLIAAYYFKQIVGIDASGNYPTVFLNYEKPDWTGLLKNDEILFVGISQSGTSISTVDMMKQAKKDGHLTIAITENLNSEITHHVDKVSHLLCGAELTPPETRGYTVTVLQLYLYAYEVAKSLNKISQQEYEKAISDANYLVDNFQKVVEESEAWYDRNATQLVNSNRIYVLGYGVDYGSPFNVAMKKAMDNENIEVYYGLNLGMLMEITSRIKFNGEEVDFTDIVEVGQKAIGKLNLNLLDEDEDSEEEL